MPNRFLRILAVSIGMFAYLANVTILGSGLVLCSEPDGRVAIELVGDHDPCLTAPRIVCSGDEAVCAEHLECNEQCACNVCPCEDAPLGVVSATLHKRAQVLDSSSVDSGTQSLGVNLPTLLHSDNYQCVALNANTFLRNSAQTLLLRNVVLLI